MNSDCWFRLLLRLYPPDFRDKIDEAPAETYRDPMSSRRIHAIKAQVFTHPVHLDAVVGKP